METIAINDKKFEISIPEREILRQVGRVADEINRDYSGRSPLLLVILDGAFIFAADLMRRLTVDAEVCFVKMASYDGMSSTGNVRRLMDFTKPVAGRDIIIVEDIVDSGLTMETLLHDLQKQSPLSVSVCSLLVKPDNLKANIDITYKCLEIPNDFIIGYGLDLDGKARQLKDIYTVTDEV